jgi:hypothetical protein
MGFRPPVFEVPPWCRGPFRLVLMRAVVPHFIGLSHHSSLLVHDQSNVVMMVPNFDMYHCNARDEA